MPSLLFKNVVLTDNHVKLIIEAMETLSQLADEEIDNFSQSPGGVSKSHEKQTREDQQAMKEITALFDPEKAQKVVCAAKDIYACADCGYIDCTETSKTTCREAK